MRPCADRGREFLGRCSFFAGQRPVGGAVRGDGADVLEHGDPALGYVVDRDPGADRLRGRDECHQFHGRDQRDHGRVCAGGVGAAGAVERRCGLHRDVVPRGGDTWRTGVLLLQFPPEGQGEVLRGGCRQHRDRVHPAVRPGPAHRANGGCHVSGATAGVWRGRLPDDRASHPAARASWAGASQACVSADGQ